MYQQCLFYHFYNKIIFFIATVSVPEKLNIVIMLEAKDSDYIKLFIKDLLRDVTIDDKNIRVGIVVYSENASIVVNLTASHKADIFQAVNKIKWITSHNANYEDAFNCTHSMVTSFDESKNIETIVVFVTFTLQEANYRSAVKGAKFAKENGMHIIAIGVSLINNTFLDLIASHPTEDNIYVVKYFQDLNTIQPQLISKLCEFNLDFFSKVIIIRTSLFLVLNIVNIIFLKLVYQ